MSKLNKVIAMKTMAFRYKYLNKSTFLSIYFVVMSLVQSLIYLNDILQSTNKEYTALNVIEQKSKLNLFTPTVKKDLSIIDGPMKIETDSFIKLDNINFKYKQVSYKLNNIFKNIIIILIINHFYLSISCLDRNPNF
jgi:hypothetical protein